MNNFYQTHLSDHSANWENPSINLTKKKGIQHIKPKKESEAQQINQQIFNTTLLTVSPPKNFFSHLIATIEQSSHKATKFKDLYDLIAAKDLDTEEQKFVYNLLEGEFRKIENEKTSQAWVQRADLLDAIDLLVKKYSHSHLPLLSIRLATPAPEKLKWKEGTVPLVPYNKIKEAARKLYGLAIHTLALRSIDDVQAYLQDEVVGEYTSTAKMIRTMTTRESWVGKIFSLFYRLLTSSLGKFYNHPAFFSKTLDQISQFSQKMGIQSIEILTQKVIGENENKEYQFYYRGPRYLFGQSIHDYRTVNDWFKRDLTPEARQEFLNRVNYKEDKLVKRYGEAEQGESRIVISNADARLRLHEIKAGEFGKPQLLTGKVLNSESEQKAKIKKDNPTYYTEKYQFTTKNLLGRASDDSMMPCELAANQIKELTQQTKKLKKARGKTKNPKEQAKLAKRVIKQKNTQELLNQAQHELLGGMYRAFQREGAVQVIQRLAPADIHNYVAPLNGTPLSHKEAATFLKEQLRAKQDHLKGQNLHATEQKAFQEEINQLSQLEHVFTQQEEILERPSQATLDIYGTNASVSTPAIQNQARILAQNDRKVMLFKHEDGSFSMHVFIGATGVNRVDVDPKLSSEKQLQGDRQGDMQFGPDHYQAKETYQTATNQTTRDGLRKLRIGERQGGFPIQGSTVISYYLPSDFTLMPKVKEFTQNALYGEAAKKETIEIQAKMGDPILIKTEIFLVEILEKSFPDLFENSASLDDILPQLFHLPLPQATHTQQEQAAFTVIKKLWGDSYLSFSETQLKERVEQLIEKRLNRLREEREVMESYPLKLSLQDKETLEDADIKISRE